MPYFQGRKVTNEEWVAARQTGEPIGWKAATGWKDGDPAVDDAAPAPAPVRQTARAKKAEAAAALAAITGLAIDLDDYLTDLSGVVGDVAATAMDEE